MLTKIIQANGSINANYTLKLEVEENSFSASTNDSYVSWRIKLTSRNNWSFQDLNSTLKVNVDGEVYNNTSSRSIGKNATIELAYGNKVIVHNSDGTKSINVGFSWEQKSSANYTPRKYVCKWSF